MGHFWWVRGGSWVPEREAESPWWLFAVEDKGRLARLAAICPGCQPGPNGPVFMPDSVLSEREWWAEVGFPAGLEPYELTEKATGQCLDQLVAFCEETPFEPFGPVTGRVDKALCSLLEEFGPLEAVPGAVPLPLSRDLEQMRTVYLGPYHLQVRQLAAAYKAVTDAVGDRRSLSHRLFEDSADALRDVQVVPQFEVDVVTFDFLALSLRAHLWRHIFWRWGRTPVRLCKLCKAAFEIEYGPGPPPRFCPEHRNPRDRKRAQRLRRG